MIYSFNVETGQLVSLSCVNDTRYMTVLAHPVTQVALEDGEIELSDVPYTLFEPFKASENTVFNTMLTDMANSQDWKTLTKLTKDSLVPFQCKVLAGNSLVDAEEYYLVGLTNLDKALVQTEDGSLKELVQCWLMEDWN